MLQISADRVAIPKSVSEFVGWYQADESQECLALPGPESGLAIFSPLRLKEQQELVDRVQKQQLAPEELGSSIARAALSVHSFWPVTIQANGELRLPAPARKLGLIVDENAESIGLTAFCDVIQLWSVPALRELLRELSGRRAELSGFIPE